MKRDINTETPLIPYIIAEQSLWNVIEADSGLKDLQPGEVSEIVARLYPALVNKAERLYSNNRQFRLTLLNKYKDCRHTLGVFMEHWALPLINKEKAKLLTTSNK